MIDFLVHTKLIGGTYFTRMPISYALGCPPISFASPLTMDHLELSVLFENDILASLYLYLLSNLYTSVSTLSNFTCRLTVDPHPVHGAFHVLVGQ